MDFTQLELVLGVIAFVASTMLGLLVFFRDRDSWTNRLFLVLSLLINAYVVVNYLSLHPPTNSPESQLFWIRGVMFVTSFIGPVLALLVHTFPAANISMRTKFWAPLLFLMVLSSSASLTQLVFKDITYKDGSAIPIPGVGIPIFILDFVGLFVLSFFILIYKFRKAQGQERSQLGLLLLGVLISFSLMGLATVLFVVLLETSSFVFLGPIFPIIMMMCIAYAIVKYKMFNMKILATQIFASALWILLLAETVTASTFSEVMVDLLVLVSTIIIGIYLIRSVKLEVKQREQMEDLTKALEQTNTKLQNLDQARSDFITIASHQLRTPPTTLKWYLSAMKLGDYGDVNPKLQDALAKTEAVNNSLIALIDDLLNASRIERGKMEFVFEPTDLTELSKITCDQLMPLASIKNLNLKFNKPDPVPPLVIADKEKIRQVINNFVDNAIKYTNSGNIDLRLHTDGDSVTVEVTDTGKGFGKTTGDTLFHKYTRGQNAAVHSTGLGLGLYVAKVVIEKHRGKIWAKSEGEGKGSVFGFSLLIHNDLPEHASLNLAPAEVINNSMSN